jgi:two-component system, NtrC family, sensor histidine kinase PilS
MNVPSASPSLFSPTLFGAGAESVEGPRNTGALWQAFMTARTLLASLLLLLQSVIYLTGGSKELGAVLVCLCYALVAVTLRLRPEPPQLRQLGRFPWLSTTGPDILAFVALQILQGQSINYAPLLVLPILTSAVLGSLRWALGAAAGVTLLLFAVATGLSVQTRGETLAHFLQAALTGAGSFLIAILGHLLAVRLVTEQQRAQRSQSAVRVQRRVNELVIEAMADGIVVLDAQGRVRTANPAARHLLGIDLTLRQSVFDLAALTAPAGLADLMTMSFAQQAPQQADIVVHREGKGPQRIRVRTRLTATRGHDAESLCVMFMQDQREIEARLRSEKLASMGRMSAAVAHEIRNPLAAIAQANALLDEDLQDARHKQLTRLVRQNAQRLEKIADDILNVSRAKHRRHGDSDQFDLNAQVRQGSQDWADNGRRQRPLRLALADGPMAILFDQSHLQRILINLLDNADRHAQTHAEGVQLITAITPNGQVSLSVWSHGPPMDQSVERHLFEPFFSSESRSSGLGLYICRELCESHGALMSYQRSCRTVVTHLVEGNEFRVVFQSPDGISAMPTALEP